MYKNKSSVSLDYSIFKGIFKTWFSIQSLQNRGKLLIISFQIRYLLPTLLIDWWKQWEQWARKRVNERERESDWERTNKNKIKQEKNPQARAHTARETECGNHVECAVRARGGWRGAAKKTSLQNAETDIIGECISMITYRLIRRQHRAFEVQMYSKVWGQSYRLRVLRANFLNLLAVPCHCSEFPLGSIARRAHNQHPEET